MIKLKMTILKIFILFLFFNLSSHADEINILQEELYLPILDKSELFIDSENHTLEEVIDKKFEKFDNFEKTYINLGLTTDTVWVKFTLKNSSSLPIDKMLVINNPLLTFIDIYKTNQVTPVKLENIRTTLSPSYNITLKPNTKTDFYIHIKSYSSVKFGLYIYNTNEYKQQDLHKQLINILFIGIIFTMMIYNFFLFFYIRDIQLFSLLLYKRYKLSVL